MANGGFVSRTTPTFENENLHPELQSSTDLCMNSTRRTTASRYLPLASTTFAALALAAPLYSHAEESPTSKPISCSRNQFFMRNGG